MLLLSLHACLMVVDFGTPPDPTLVIPDPTGATGTTGDTGTTGTIGDTGPTTGTTVFTGPALVVGDAAGDRIGEGGVWITADGALAVAGSGALARFATVPTATVPFSAARLVVRGATIGPTFAAAGDRLAIGQPSTGTVWLVSSTTTDDGPAASLAVGSITTTESDSAFGAAIAAGDWDGDGLPDLATGDPAAHSGDGDAYIGFDVGSATAWDASEGEVRLRGAGGLGIAVLLGPLGGTGADDLLGCDTVGNGRCSWVAGGQAIDQDDMDNVADGVLSGSVADPLVGLPQLVDVDADGAEDLLLRTNDAAGVWFGPLAAGAANWSTVDWRVDGAGITAATGADGSLVLGAGGDLVLVAGGVTDLATGTILDSGAELGAAIAAPSAAYGLAAAAPGERTDAGEVRLRAWP